MGVVYRARQVSLNRTVALKMILAGRLASAAEVRRFRTEAEAAAQLDHPDIVPIYEVGEHDGPALLQHEASSRAAAWRRTRSPTARCRSAAAELVREVAGRCTTPTSDGVLHRDLKPANILLDAAGPAARHRLRPGQADRGRQRPDASPARSWARPATWRPSRRGPARRRRPGGRRLQPGGDPLQLLTGRPPFRRRDVARDAAPGHWSASRCRHGSSTPGSPATWRRSA